jgi:hypothetical protein
MRRVNRLSSVIGIGLTLVARRRVRKVVDQVASARSTPEAAYLPMQLDTKSTECASRVRLSSSRPEELRHDS